MFFNCVDSLLAYHNGAIIATLSKNDVPFDVGDVVTVLHCLEKQNTADFIHVLKNIVCIYVTSIFLA